MPEARAYVVAIDHGYEGWTQPEAVCATRAAALAYIGAHANDGRGGQWKIVELRVLTAETIEAETRTANA